MTAPTLPPGVSATPVDSDATGPQAKPRRRLRAAAPPWLLALVGSGVAVVVGLAVAAIPMVLMWITSGQTGLTWTETARGSALLLAVAHGTPVVVGTVGYSVVPWGFVLLPALLLAGCAGWVARRTSVRDYRQFAVQVAVMSLSYAVAMVIVARLAVLGDAHVSEISAFLHTLAVAVVATGVGAARSAELPLPRHPATAVVLTCVRAAAIGVVTLLAVGAIAAAASLVAHVDDVIEMTRALHPGAWGGLLLLLVGLGYLPVLIVWSTSYVIGAGVVIGPAIVVSPFVPATAPTQLPPFPLLAAVPQSAGPLSWALPALGFAAGALVGLTISRRARAESRLLRLGMAAAAALMVGAVMALLAFLASGSLGDLRLASVGPVPSTVGILSAVIVMLGAVPAAVIASSPARPRLRTAEDDAPPVSDSASIEPEPPAPSMEGHDDV